MAAGRWRARGAALMAILIGAGTATADQPVYQANAGAPYLGGSLSRVNLDRNDNPFLDADVEETGYKAYLGYAFNDVLRAEMGYVDFGRYQARFDLPGPGFQNVDLNAHGTTLSAELAVPLAEDIAVFAKAGLVFWEAEGIAGGFGLAEDGEDGFFGLGMRFRLAPNLDVAGGFERYRLAETDVDVTSLGLALRF
jgi:hypothetical protein